MQLDDTVLKTIETAEQPELQAARKIIQQMRRRQLYQVPTERTDTNSRSGSSLYIMGVIEITES
jgi:hypothetical protein